MKGYLGDVAQILLGGTPDTSRPEFWDGDIPWVTPSDITDAKHVVTTERTITEAGLFGSNTKLSNVGDVVISARGSVGKIVECDRQMAFNQSCYALRTRDQNILHQSYLYYLLQQCVRYLRQNAVGSVFNAIVMSTLERTRVCLPAVESQKRIAYILSAYDDLMENNQRRISLLDQAARSLYKEWFVHFRFPGHEHVKINGDVPEGWGKKTAFDVLDVLSGGTPKTDVPDYWGEEIPFFTPKDTSDSAYVFVTEKALTETGLKSCNSALYPKNTVFITARGTVGNIMLAGVPMAMNQSCYALVAKPPLNQVFLYFAIKESVEQFRSRAVGSVFDAIIRDTFKLIPFVVPEEKLVRLFTDYAKPVLSQIHTLMNQTQKLAQARDLLLPRLINGEAPVQV